MTNDLTPHQQHHQPAQFLPPQDEYRQVTDLATRLSSTAFVPSDLRGDPASVLAAMLTGREIGLAPMESLRSVHMIEGRPTLSAEATMKLALEGGHLLVVTESTRESATVRYRNANWPDSIEDQHVTFDMDDADSAGLKTRAMWKKYPRAMLRSRAITEAARAGGLLASAAMAYTAEELDDGDTPDEIVVESMSPDDEDVEIAQVVEDETELRRDLYRQAGRAARKISAHDEAAGAAAWTGANAGVDWADTDLEILRQRVEDIERQADEYPDPEPDEDEGGEPTGDDPDDSPDDVVDAEVVDEDEVDPGDETQAAIEADVLEGDGSGEPLPEVDEDSYAEDAEPLPEDSPIEQARQAATGAARAQALPDVYGDLLATDVARLVRGERVSVAGGWVEAAPHSVWEQEQGRDGPFRKTVKAALDQVGYRNSETKDVGEDVEW